MDTNITAIPTRLRLRTEIQTSSTLWAENGARKAAWQCVKNFVLKNLGTHLENEATVFKPKLEWAVASTSTVNPDERDFIVDSGASMHMMSKMDSSPEELETLKMFRLLATVITANGSIDTTEEATVNVKDFGHVRAP